MSKELTLDGLEALARRATPGPWWIDSHGHTLTSQADAQRIHCMRCLP